MTTQAPNSRQAPMTTQAVIITLKVQVTCINSSGKSITSIELGVCRVSTIADFANFEKGIKTQ